MCYYYSHIMRQANSTRPPVVLYGTCKVTWFCTCTQKSDWQRINKRQEHKHGNNHCPDLLKIKTIKFCGKIRKTPKGADQLYSRSKETRQTQNPWQISGF